MFPGYACEQNSSYVKLMTTSCIYEHVKLGNICDKPTNV